MIQIVTVPSPLRGTLVVVSAPSAVFVPLPNFGLSPMKIGTASVQSLWTSTVVGVAVWFSSFGVETGVGTAVAALAGGSSAVYGVEAAMWSETLKTVSDLEYMAFPRLPAVAEVGWSPPSAHDLGAFEERLAAQAPHWVAAGIGFARTPGVPWPPG